MKAGLLCLALLVLCFVSLPLGLLGVAICSMAVEVGKK